MDINFFVQSELYPFSHENEAVYPPFEFNTTEDTQLELQISEYLIDDVLHLIHKYGLINIQVPESYTKDITVRIISN
jgi:hypothetical protein